jgi:hypothetical protein
MIILCRSYEPRATIPGDKNGWHATIMESRIRMLGVGGRLGNASGQQPIFGGKWRSAATSPDN